MGLSVKMPPPQQVKLAISCDSRHIVHERSYEGPCLAHDIWAVNRDIPLILQGSIEVRHDCRIAKNLGSPGENAVNIKRQTCDIVRYHIRIHFCSVPKPDFVFLQYLDLRMSQQHQTYVDYGHGRCLPASRFSFVIPLPV